MPTLPPRDPAQPDLAKFWQGCDRHELTIPRCRYCEAYQWPPRPTCPRCHHRDFAWKRVPGTGIVYSTTRVGRTSLPGFERLTPYDVVIVELDPPISVRLVGSLDGFYAAMPAIGAAVAVSFQPPSDGVTMPVWSLVEKGTSS